MLYMGVYSILSFVTILTIISVRLNCNLHIFLTSYGRIGKIRTDLLCHYERRR